MLVISISALIFSSLYFSIDERKGRFNEMKLKLSIDHTDKRQKKLSILLG